MAALYADLIRKGLRTLESVPERWREEAGRLLKQVEDNV